MMSQVVDRALAIVYGALRQICSGRELEAVGREIGRLAGREPLDAGGVWEQAEACSCQEAQQRLGRLNEKETVRKTRGVYYTPLDVVRFLLIHAGRLSCGTWEPERISDLSLEGIDGEEFCLDKTVCDPTCGTGEFLLAALELKLDIWERCKKGGEAAEDQKRELFKIVSTIGGNDSNPDSIVIAKLRLFLCVLGRYGSKAAEGMAAAMDSQFTCYDFVMEKPEGKARYDVMVGNPPYVEDAKSGLSPEVRYGNIYANVLEHAAIQLKEGGVLGFVIPLSYISTPRMGRIRERLFEMAPEQCLLSYSDRPDCLFASVHQKLCLLLGRKGVGERRVYTGNYRYWYKEERELLFSTAAVVKNDFGGQDYIPKLGTRTDVEIYEKIAGQPERLSKLFGTGRLPVYLNMRAAFWIKAFLHPHKGSEYRELLCGSREEQGYAVCLLNSSLFWWYWICVSDCWHITKKELEGFGIPELPGEGCGRAALSEEGTSLAGHPALSLARRLEERLEETKRYVGTRQTEYEYKHRDCVEEIHAIDRWIGELYGLTEKESRYIQEFALRYRVSGGAKDGCH